MRRTRTPAITSQMYRHFAVVTVLLSATVALLANGGDEQAAASREAEQIRPTRPEKPHLVQAKASPSGDSGTWGSDDSDGFGQPTMGSSFNSSRTPSSPTEKLGPEDRADGDQGDAEAATAGPTLAQIAAAEAASRLRSGSAAGD